MKCVKYCIVATLLAKGHITHPSNFPWINSLKIFRCATNETVPAPARDFTVSKERKYCQSLSEPDFEVQGILHMYFKHCEPKQNLP